MMSYFGVYQWGDGRIYVGCYHEDKKHGYGIYTWPDKKIYGGHWYNGK